MLSASSLGGLKRPKAAQDRRDERRRQFSANTSNASMKARLRGGKAGRKAKHG
jgi:hypothetical protein